MPFSGLFPIGQGKQKEDVAKTDMLSFPACTVFWFGMFF